MTYYEKLGVLENVSKSEIKKAYFVLVKKYPPEKYPEEFKGYRKAYEVLSDDNARAQYDKLIQVPKEYKALYDEALHAMEYGAYEEAISLLKEVVKANPKLQILNSLLGEIYLENENSGNAIKIFERLVKLEAGNISYHEKLGQAYSMRGYTKKAIQQYEKTLAMEPDNRKLYGALVVEYVKTNRLNQAWDTVKEGIARLGKGNQDNLELYLYEVYLCIMQCNVDNMQEALEVLRHAVEHDPALIDYITETLLRLIGSAGMKPDMFASLFHVINFLHELAPHHKKLTDLKNEMQNSYILYQLSQDKNVPNYIMELTRFSLAACGCIYCKIERVYWQMEVLFDIDNARRQLRYVKEHYPEAYRENKEFYDKAMQPSKFVRLQEELCKKMKGFEKKYPNEFHEVIADDLGFDIEEDDEFWDPYMEYQPYKREESKVGRNDPCPCGSGQKYKRCCGK